MQQLGRVMRPHEGKEYALWLDHAGNLQRFAEDHAEVFENGVQDLDHATYDAKPRQEKLEEEKIEWQCGECKYFFQEAHVHRVAGKGREKNPRLWNWQAR